MKAGVLLVDKPSGYTSFDVIAVLRAFCMREGSGIPEP